MGCLFFLLWGISACNHPQQKTIAPPKDTAIPTEIIQQYIGKTCISLLNRRPTEQELTQYTRTLSSQQLSVDAVKGFVNSLIAQSEYPETLYKVAMGQLLNHIYNPDSSQLQITIDIWKSLKPTIDQSQKEIDAEVERLIGLQRIPKDLASEFLDNIGLQKRLTHNSYYDFVNMGTENFVVSVFENFLLRYPTAFELEQGKKMVDGSKARIFGQYGNSKTDFVRIFFDSPEYFEGQVRQLFLKHLFREPSSEEMVELTRTFMQSKNYAALQRHILTLDEYIGWKKGGQL